MKPAEGNRVGRKYLQWARKSPPEERDLRGEVLARLPARILDSHAHANGAAAVGELSDYGWSQTRSSFPEWSIEDSATVHEFLYGEHRVSHLWIAQPYRGIDHRAANEYLLSEAGDGDIVALCGLPDDRDYTTTELRQESFAALKMYPHYREPPYTRLTEYFPDWSLAAAGAAEVPAIVHLPLPLAECLSEILVTARRFPSVRMILAHLGRHSSVDAEVTRAFEIAASCPNLAMDTSMAASRAVHELAFSTFGPERVMFGSDEPFNLLRYIPVIDSSGQRHNVSSRPYHWLRTDVHQRYGHTATNAVLLHFQVLSAMLSAIDTIFSSEVNEVIERAFFVNARHWLNWPDPYFSHH